MAFKRPFKGLLNGLQKVVESTFKGLLNSLQKAVESTFKGLLNGLQKAVGSSFKGLLKAFQRSLGWLLAFIVIVHFYDRNISADPNITGIRLQDKVVS